MTAKMYVPTCRIQFLMLAGSPLIYKHNVIYLQKYSFAQIADLVELPGAFMIGAGAGPFHHVGCNSEVRDTVCPDV